MQTEKSSCTFLKSCVECPFSGQPSPSWLFFVSFNISPVVKHEECQVSSLIGSLMRFLIALIQRWLQWSIWHFLSKILYFHNDPLALKFYPPPLNNLTDYPTDYLLGVFWMRPTLIPARNVKESWNLAVERHVQFRIIGWE